MVLDRHEIIATTDLDELRAGIAGALTSHRLERHRRGGTLDGRLSAVRVGDLSLIGIRNGGMALDAELNEPVDYYDIHLGVHGANRLLCQGREITIGPGRGAIICPQQRFGLRLGEAYEQLHVRIERSTLERHLEALLGGVVPGPIRFDLGFDLTSPRGASWARTVGLLVAELDQPGIADNPLAAANWSQLLLTGLLLSQPHAYAEHLERPRAPSGPAPVKRAIAFIADNADRPLTASDIAQAAGTSVRSLQRAFHERLGTSPMGYLRHVRLERVHAELAGASRADGTTVTEVAMRWGFTHLPRFAAAYRGRYGRSPSQTLRGDA
jgi:AraC-like DNA-binding protein